MPYPQSMAGANSLHPAADRLILDEDLLAFY
jgi:hypothetical protein